MITLVPCRGGYQVHIRRENHPLIVRSFPTRRRAEKYAEKIEGVITRRFDAACAAAETMTFSDALDRYEQEIPPWTKPQAAIRSLIKTLKSELGGYTLTMIPDT